MKLRTLSVLTFCFCIVVSAFAQKKVLQAGSTFVFDTGTGNINYGDSVIFHYFPVPDEIFQSREWSWSLTNQTWEQIYKWIDYQFDANGNLTSYVVQSGSDVTGWNNQTRSTSIFNANNRLVNWVLENWTGSSWASYYTYTATYSPDDKVLIEDGGSYAINYFYDAQGVLAESILSFKDANGEWKPDTKSVYSSDNNGQTEYVTDYSLVDSVWTEKQKLTKNYDGAGNLTQLLSQNWNITTWENYSLDTYYYDASNNNTDELWQFWNNGTWNDVSRTKNTYDSDNDLVGIQSDNAINGEWLKSIVRTNYYTLYVPTGEPAGPGFQMFPNPASTQLLLKGADLDRMTIYSQDGKLVRTQALQESEVQTIPLALPDGQYFLQVSDAHGGVSTRPLQVIH